MGADDSEDRLLRIAGVVLVVAVVAGFGVLVLAAANASPSSTAGPDVEFSISRVNASHVRVVHAGGRSVPAGDVVVTVDGKIRQLSWSGSGRVVSEGDRALLVVRGAQVVRVWWEGAPGARTLLDSERLE